MKISVNKRTQKFITKVENFNVETASAWERLNVTRAKVEIGNMGVNKLIRTFLEEGANVLTDAQKAVLTFENVVNFINSSEELKGVKLFTTWQMNLICNQVVKLHDRNTKLSEKVAKQSKKVATVTGVKAEKVTRNTTKKGA
jgi:hypothetical protein